jgi:DNA-binding NtrC family response regulator
MSPALQVLFIEDSEDDVKLLLRELRKASFDPSYRRVETAEDLRSALAAQTWDLILSDFSMPRFDGLAAFELCGEMGTDAPFLLVSGRVGEERAVEAMRKGVKDYIVKDNLRRFIPAVRREIAELELRRESVKTQRALAESEDKYKHLVEGSIQGILIVQRGKIVYCNPSVARMLGYGDPRS